MKKSKKKKKKINTNKLILVLMLALMMTVSIAVFLKSNIFDLQQVTIKGNKELKTEDVISELDIIQNKNIFSYDSKNIKSTLMQNPYIEDVNIKLKLPSTMIISIKEITPSALLKDDNNYCYISSKGEKIVDIKDLDENTDKIIVDIDYVNKENSIEFENDEIEKRLLYLLDCVVDKNINKEIYEINLREENIISLKTKNNTKVIIPNDDNLDYNVSRLGKILVDLQSKNKKEGTIDLTYSNYALYSPK